MVLLSNEAEVDRVTVSHRLHAKLISMQYAATVGKSASDETQLILYVLAYAIEDWQSFAL